MNPRNQPGLRNWNRPRCARPDLVRVPDVQRRRLSHGFLSAFIGLSTLLVFSSLPCWGSEPQKTPRILYVNSYHPGYTWSDMILDGMRQTLSTHYGQQYDLRVEYLDAKRYAPELSGELGESIRSAWRAKYSGLPIDIILVSDQDGYNFISRFRNELFPGVPLLFSGVEEPGIIAPHTTGVLASTDYAENLALIRRVLPSLQELWVVTDPTTTGAINRRRFADAAQAFTGKMKISYFDENNQGIMPDALIEKASALGEGAAIFFLDYYRTPENEAVPVPQFIKNLCGAATVPVFSHVDIYIDYGVTGGHMNSGEVQGRQLAELAFKIIGGVDVSTLQPEIERAVSIFDEQKLEQFGIPAKSLPKNSFIQGNGEARSAKYSRAFPGAFSDTIYARGDHQYPPFEFINSKGEPDGFNVEIIKAVAAAMGMEATIELGVWDEVRRQLEEGEIDLLIGMYHTPERDLKVDFSVPMFLASYAVYVRADSSIKGMDDLKDKTVLVQKGDLAHDYVAQNGIAHRVIEKSEWVDVLLSLSKGEGDAAVVARLQGNEFIESRNLANIFAVGPPVIQRKYCMAVTEGNSLLLAKINEGLSLIKTSGEYDRIYQKWFGVLDREVDVAWIIQKTILWVVLPFAALLVAAFGFSWALKRQVQRKTRELQRGEERFRAIFEAMPFPVMVARLSDGKHLIANDAHCRLTGLPRSEIIGKTSIEMGVAPEVSNRHKARLLETGRLDGVVVEMPKSDGAPQWFQYSACRAEMDGEQIAITGLIDITDRKLAEETLRISEIKLRSLFAAMQDVIVVLDAHGRYIEIVPTSSDQLNRPSDQLLGKTLAEVLPEELAVTALRSIRDVLAQGSRRSLDYQLEIAGQPVWFSASISPYTADSVLLVARDISERKRAEEALQKRLVALTQPLNSAEEIAFEDLFNLADLQRLQDEFANATGVASIITRPDGRPITAPSNFTHLCMNIIRKTEKGCANCYKSDAELGRQRQGGPAIQPCLSGGLWDAGSAISVGGRHVANWLIGQVRDAEQTEVKMRAYAREIGADEDAVAEAFRAVPAMSRERFSKVAGMLFTLANQLSNSAYQNIQQARFITERKQAEESLKESEVRFRTLVQNLQDMIFVLDESGTITYESPSVAMILGHPPEHYVGRPTLDVIHPDDRDRIAREIQKAFQGQSAGLIGYRTQHADGGWRFIEAVASVPIEGSGISGIVVTARNVTERKQAEEEKEKLQEQLIQSQKMESVGRLAGGVAHDFNNMLFAIMGHAELAQERVGTDERLRADLDEILNAARRSADLTRQLLAFARKQTVAPKVLDLNETVEGMLKMLHRLIGEHIDLAWLPGTGTGSILIDPSQVDQMLANLCVNARDAIADTGRITIQTNGAVLDEAYCADHVGLVPGEYVLLAVSDDGCGMDKETQAKIFEPFFTTKEMGKGTGLGLATVYGIVKQNNGFINVYSEPGIGTTFRIYLPKVQHRDAQAPAAQAAETVMRGSETILFVEDEPMIRELGKKMLNNLGYKVLDASAAGEAIRLAKEYPGRIHLLITDLIMPNMNGRDLAKSLLASYPNLRVVFMSGYTSDVIAHQGILDPGVHFIQKPISQKQLSVMVRKALDP